jgi:hypothetical protein
VLLAVRRLKIILFFVICVTTVFVLKIVIFKNMPDHGRNIDAGHIHAKVCGIQNEGDSEWPLKVGNRLGNTPATEQELLDIIAVPK